MSRPLVLFDADCGFCTKTAHQLPGRWFKSRVDLQPLQQADLETLGLELDEVLALMHVVRSDGSMAIGHVAWAEILRHSRQPWPVVGRLLTAPGLNRLAAAVYAWVAEHRDKMPGGTPACSLDDRPGSAGPTAARPTAARPTAETATVARPTGGNRPAA